MKTQSAGIASLGLHFPKYYLDITTLAELRNVDANKYLQGLGCYRIAVSPHQENAIVELAATAAKRALSRWDGDPADIGLIAVGTESAIDMSRPLSAWVADELNLRGAIDIAEYAERDLGEPTQGAGAIALIIDQPKIATIDIDSYCWSSPAFDFWRPLGHAHPLVSGQFSLECYQQAAIECFRQLFANYGDPEQVLAAYKAHCFHVPFPKMVKKAVMAIGHSLNWDEKKIETFYSEKVDNTMDWNRQTGNSYTASLWVAVAHTLTKLKPEERITAFSYGSGFGAELLTLTANQGVLKADWSADVDADFNSRHALTKAEYIELRTN